MIPIFNGIDEPKGLNKSFSQYKNQKSELIVRFSGFMADALNEQRELG